MFATRISEQAKLFPVATKCFNINTMRQSACIFVNPVIVEEEGQLSTMTGLTKIIS